MTNQPCGLAASAILIAAGELTLSLGLVATATNPFRSGSEVVGIIILVVCSILFFFDHIKSIKD